jgi:hypothetical protein
VRQFQNTTKEPTDKQFKHIQILYEAVSGTKYTGVGKQEFETLSTRKDIQEVFDYLDSHQDLAKKACQYTKYGDANRIIDIVSSIRRYGTISKRQMDYVDALLKAYSEINP